MSNRQNRNTRKVFAFFLRNIGAFITFSAAFTFLLIRLIDPEGVKGNVADVLLLISLPLLVIAYLILYKVEEARESATKNKEEILASLGLKFRLFENKTECDEYYKMKTLSSKSVLDLTWAETNRNNNNNNSDYLDFFNHLSSDSEVSEIFIFTIDGKPRLDRIHKLKTVYDLIKGGRNLNYSCSYYPETTFERLQFTIFDESEILFTSSYYKRFAIAEPSLTSVLKKYYEKSWEESTKLIENGRIVDINTIEKIISTLNLHA